MDNYDCIIVANGDFPALEYNIKLIENAKYLIVCDGGAEELIDKGFIPDNIVGDMDSTSLEIKEKFKDIIVYYKEQETNDLTKSVSFAKKSGFKNVAILGATGKREDHTLGNISLLADYCEWFEKIEIITDYGTFVSINKTTTFESFEGQQVSIFSLTPDTYISTEGLKYPIAQRQLTSWWQGTLNEALSNEFTISFTNGKLILFLKNKN
ncbi:MAG: thiamine diphosphokinase [Bacteroidales bacterium]|nr:thiamine diphosphokinase [Bacteroidales bacterium]